MRGIWAELREENGLPGVSDGKESACSAGDLIPSLGQEDLPGDGNGNPLQSSCLENSTDRGAWRATVQGVSKHRTRLSNWNLGRRGVSRGGKRGLCAQRAGGAQSREGPTAVQARGKRVGAGSAGSPCFLLYVLEAWGFLLFLFFSSWILKGMNFTVEHL